MTIVTGLDSRYLFEGLVITRDMLVHHVPFAKALATKLAVVGVHVGKVDVLYVLVGGAPVLERLAAQAAAKAERSAGRVTALQVLRET